MLRYTLWYNPGVERYTLWYTRVGRCTLPYTRVGRCTLPYYTGMVHPAVLHGYGAPCRIPGYERRGVHPGIYPGYERRGVHPGYMPPYHAQVGMYQPPSLPVYRQCDQHSMHETSGVDSYSRVVEETGLSPLERCLFSLGNKPRIPGETSQ